MKLSLEVLYDELSFLNPVINSKKNTCDMIYTGVQILNENIRPLINHFKIIDPEYVKNYLKNSDGLLFVNLPHQFVCEDVEYINFRKDVTTIQLLTEIQSIFQKYNNWEDELNEVINNNGSIQELCMVAGKVFDNPLIIYDNNLLVLALANDMPGLPEWEFDQASKKPTLPLEILNDFKLDNEFNETMSTHGSHLYAKHILGCRGIYNNLWIDGTYSGRVCIHELGRELQKKDYCLLNYVTNLIADMLKKNDSYKNKNIELLEKSFKDIMEGNKVNELFFNKQLSEINWSKNDTHICVQIMIEERDSRTSSLKYTCSKLENQFQNSIVFSWSDSIIMIMNLTKTQKSISDLMAELKIFLREGLFRAGISMISNDFFKIRESYIQTSLAVKVGEKIDPMYWYFHFDDYSVQAMFYEISKDISVEMFCDSSLYKLLDYDTLNETQLYETLMIYLTSNMNIAHTAEKLYIHRSTLLYRLERINTLINVDLKNPDSRFKLLLSFYLLKWNK